MNTAQPRKLPIGVDSFEEIRSENFYYVDKTLLIRDLLNNWGKVNLFTRPRRFGKSLNMSMLKSFFEIGSDASLFDGTAIAEETELCREYMGKFPVVSISLKDVNGNDYSSARAMMCSVIGNEAMRFQYLLDDNTLTERERLQYEQLVQIGGRGEDSFVMSDSILAGSIKVLTALLEKHFGRKAIVLIDEYDVPLAKANEKGYYDPMITLIRNMFGQALKTNDSLHFAVLTGCLRVAKESIFTGLNNLKILSITNVQFDEYFGFTDREVREMLSCYGLEHKYETVKNWYDGYRFGNADVYCPWDMISYCDALTADPDAEPQNYWSNTSGNDVVRHFIEKMGDGLTRGEMEDLIAGETVIKQIHEDLTYNRLYDSIDHIWSVLFATGYLTQRGKATGKNYQLAIPNMEIRNIFTEQIMAMFQEDAAKDGETLQAFCDALQTGNAPEVERMFSEYLGKTISIRDTFVKKPTKENFFHGILLGILGYKNGWYVKSGKESEDGYSDIIIYIEDDDIGIIIEVKYAEKAQFDHTCRQALRQIEEKNYAAELEARECREILKYGIACYRKKCKVMLEKY